jgi:hypothetical protein
LHDFHWLMFIRVRVGVIEYHKTPGFPSWLALHDDVKIDLVRDKVVNES